MTMANGQQRIERVVSDRDPCPDCGYRARILRQSAETPPAGLVGRVLGSGEAGPVVESRARVVETWALCLHCLRRERWGWEGGEWKLLEELRITQDADLVSRHGSWFSYGP